MAFMLVVKDPFGAYAKGTQITDADEIERTLVFNAAQVVKVTVEDAKAEEPAPVPAEDPKPKPFDKN